MRAPLILVIGLVVSCGGASQEGVPDPNVDSVTESVPSTSTSVVETTTSLAEVIPSLATDSRVTTNLSKPEDCRIGDLSNPPDRSAESSSGFPRPVGLADKNRLRILAIPVGTGNDSFTDSDKRLVEENLGETTRFFESMSYGMATVDWTLLEVEKWVAMDQTSEELGLTGGAPTTDREAFVESVIDRVEMSMDISEFDVVGVFLPGVDKILIGQAVPSDRLTDSGKRQHFTLVGGGYMRFWQVFAHELGHAWVGFEDLYSFEQQSQFLGAWDIMQLALLVTGPELTAWNRWIAGWLDDSQVRCVASSGTTGHFIAPVEGMSKQPRMIVAPTGDGSAVVVESRRIKGYDKGGDLVLVYSVDTSVQSGQGPIRLVAELTGNGATAESGDVRVTLLESDTDGDLVEMTVS